MSLHRFESKVCAIFQPDDPGVVDRQLSRGRRFDGYCAHRQSRLLHSSANQSGRGIRHAEARQNSDVNRHNSRRSVQSGQRDLTSASIRRCCLWFGGCRYCDASCDGRWCRFETSESRQRGCCTATERGGPRRDSGASVADEANGECGRVHAPYHGHTSLNSVKNIRLCVCRDNTNPHKRVRSTLRHVERRDHFQQLISGVTLACERAIWSSKRNSPLTVMRRQCGVGCHTMYG